MKLLERYKVLVVVSLLAFALGSYVANETGRRSERPLLRWISTAAKWGLRAMVFLEPAPPELEPPLPPPQAETRTNVKNATESFFILNP